MKRIQITSAQITSLGYDAVMAVLEVEFADGGVYSYSGVPMPLYAQLLASFSKSQFFDEHIRGRFPATRTA